MAKKALVNVITAGYEFQKGKVYPDEIFDDSIDMSNFIDCNNELLQSEAGQIISQDKNPEQIQELIDEVKAENTEDAIFNTKTEIKNFKKEHPEFADADFKVGDLVPVIETEPTEPDVLDDEATEPTEPTDGEALE